MICPNCKQKTKCEKADQWRVYCDCAEGWHPWLEKAEQEWIRATRNKPAIPASDMEQDSGDEPTG